MSRRAAAFTRADVTRAIKGLENAGYEIRGVKIDGGKVIVLTDRGERGGSKSETDALDQELAEFEARHGQS